MTHSELVEIAYNWALKRGNCGIAFKEFRTAASNGECPDVIGMCSWGNSTLIEVKVSRSDFLADKKKMFRMYPDQGMGTFRFYCCPIGLIKIQELPDNWGLIYVSETGKAKCVFNPYNPKMGNIWRNGFNKNYQAEHGLMYSALRRLFLKGDMEKIYDKQYQYN